jgi:peptidoglycan lytic transglycosylase
VIRSLPLGLILLVGRLSPIVAQSAAAESTSTAATSEPVAEPAATMTAPDSSPAAPSAIDSLLAAATDAIARGLPYRASRMLDSVVRDSARRTPEATLLAAQAASRWGGWREVSRLLAEATWSDERLRGPALLLAARAAVELGADTAAVARAREALADVGDPNGRAEAVVVLGRAFDRLGEPDSAAAAYIRAAELVPAVGDWLRLRAAALTADSLGRAMLYSSLRLAAAKGRVPATEAAARQRFGDLIGAASFYLRLGSPATALRLRLAASFDTLARAELRHELVDFIGTPGPAPERRAAIAVLDSAYGGLTPEEDLAVARAAGPAGVPARAIDGFSRAFAAGLGEMQDHFDYAGALFHLGRYPEAAAAFALVPAKDKLGGAAAYQRGRAFLRSGQLDQATQVFRQVVKRFPKDTAAATSLFLLADLATDDRKDGDARKLFLQVAHRFPATRLPPGARLQAALIALVGGHAKDAAHELESLVAAGPRAGDEQTAALYWAGRAWAKAGDSARARERWAAVMARDPVSYYAGLSERRLSAATWSPPAAPDSFAPAPGQDSAMARAALLRRLGVGDAARYEYDQVARDADSSVEALLSVANAFREAGLASQGIRLARSALAHGAAADARLYRLLYPVVHAEALVTEAGAHGLEPGLVAALIRQESLFDPGATSGAGARGLMQVMPDLGATVARSRGFPQWDPVLLWQPDVSLVIGTLHLAELAARYGDPVRILAAYNAGISRVDRWAGKNGMDDPDIFAERIPFVETRDYVRIVQRNRDLYRVLYGW